MTLTEHTDAIRDALLQSAGTMRLLLYTEALPARFRDEISKRIEMSEAAIVSLRRINVALQLHEGLDFQAVEDLITEQATVSTPAVKRLLALPQKTQ